MDKLNLICFHYQVKDLTYLFQRKAVNRSITSHAKNNFKMILMNIIDNDSTSQTGTLPVHLVSEPPNA